MHPGNHKKNEMARYLQQHRNLVDPRIQEVGQNNEHLLEEQQNRPINEPPINAIPPMNPALVNPAAAAMNRDDNHERKLVVDALFMLSGQQPVPNELHEPRNGLQDNNAAVLVGYNYDNAVNTFSALYYHPVWGYMSYANGVLTHVPNDHLYQPGPVEAIDNGHVPNGYFQQPQPVEENGNEEVGMEVDANFQQPLAFITNDDGRAELAANINFDQQPPVEANGNEHVGKEVDTNFQQPSAFMANEGRAELAENVNLLSLAFMENANRQVATGEIGEQAQKQQIDVDSDTAPAVAVQDALFKLGNRPENGQEKGDEVEMDEGHEDDHVDEHVNEPVNGPTGESEPDMASSSSSSGYDASDDDESTQTIKTEISSNSDPDEQYVDINVAPDRESLDAPNGNIPLEERSSGSDDKNGIVPPSDVDAQVEVAGPAILADGANDQVLQADNQDNDGPGEVNNGNVPPNGDNHVAQVVSRSDRQLRPRPNLKRKAEDNDGPGEVNNGNVPPNGDNHVAQVVSDRELRPRPNLKRKAEKGPTYVFDVLMYKDASFYLVHWCRNDWSEYPTTIPVAKVKQSSVLARKYEGQCHRYDEWLENVRQRSNFNDEVRRIRQLAKGLKADSAKMKRLSVDENGEKVDDEMEPKQTEFHLIYERFKVRFCDRLDLQDIKRTLFAFNENWHKWFLFSYSCYLDSLENNFKGDDHTYGLLDLHIICKHMAKYNSMADFDEDLQEERRANGLTIS